MWKMAVVPSHHIKVVADSDRGQGGFLHTPLLLQRREAHRARPVRIGEDRQVILEDRRAVWMAACKRSIGCVEDRRTADRGVGAVLLREPEPTAEQRRR